VNITPQRLIRTLSVVITLLAAITAKGQECDAEAIKVLWGKADARTSSIRELSRIDSLTLSLPGCRILSYEFTLLNKKGEYGYPVKVVGPWINESVKKQLESASMGDRIGITNIIVRCEGCKDDLEPDYLLIKISSE
jgi:hypothetical protein